MKIHIVQQGDTLWKLAKKYNVDFEQLKAVNSHLSNPDVIMPGMKIKIPTAGVPVKKEAVKEQPIQQPSAPKEMPKVKEAPVQKKEAKVPPPPPKMPEVKQPIVQQPIQMQPIQPMPVTQQQLYDMNLNFNIYKPMQPVPPPAPPKMPEPPKKPVEKQLPKVEKSKPMMPKKEIPTPPPKPVEEEEMAPITAPLYQMPQQNCYPVTGVMPGCYGYQPMMSPYQAFPQNMGMPQVAPTGYPANMGMPQVAPTGYPTNMGMPQATYGYAHPAMPTQMPGYGQPTGHYTAGPIQGSQPTANMPENYYDDDELEEDQFQGLPPMMPSPMMPMQPPQNNWSQQPYQQPLYGDVTTPQQPMPMVPQHQMPLMPHMPMVPQMPYGYPAQPMQQNYPSYTAPHQGQDEEDIED